MRCETTSSVKECALRARSTHGVHHAIVEVNIVIGVVLCEVLVACVVPHVVDAVIGLALSLIAHVVVVFVVAILHIIFCIWRYTLYRTMILAISVVVDESKCLGIPILKLSTIWEHLSFLPGYKQIQRLLLVHRNLAIWM